MPLVIFSLVTVIFVILTIENDLVTFDLEKIKMANSNYLDNFKCYEVLFPSWNGVHFRI